MAGYGLTERRNAGNRRQNSAAGGWNGAASKG
jgi:hypothetical protein